LQAEFEELEEDDSVSHMSSPSSSPGAAISTSCHCQGDNSTPSPVSCNQTSNKHKTVEVRDDTQHQQQQRAGLSRTNSLDVEEKSPPPPPRVRVMQPPLLDGYKITIISEIQKLHLRYNTDGCECDSHMKSAVFWIFMLCSSEEAQLFKGICCLHYLC
jgi:hypothetical protein